MQDQPTEHQSHEKKRERNYLARKKNTPIAEFKSTALSKNPLSNLRS